MSASHTATSSAPSSTSTKFDVRRVHAQAGRLELGCSGDRARRRPARGGARRSPAPRRAAMPAASAARLTLNGSCTRSSSRATSGVRDRVAEAQARQAEDLRERADHDHGAPAEHVARAIDAHGRVGEVDVGLVRDDDAVGGQAVEEGRPCGAARRACPWGCSDRRSRRGARRVAPAASATASRSIASPAGGTRVTIPPAAADTVA